MSSARATLLLLFTALCSCGDAGSRDRSLDRPVIAEARVEHQPTLPEPKRAPRGLMADPLSVYYSADATLIVRFDEPATLIREAVPQLSEVAGVLPQLAIPDESPTELLRRFLALPEGIAFDARFPFALVKVADGWVGIVVALNAREAPEHFQPLDNRYFAAGDPALLESYRAAFDRGFYLPGDMSLILREGSLPVVSERLRAYARSIRLDPGRIASWEGLTGRDLERIDLAFRFGQAGLRIDARLGARPGSGSVECLKSLHRRQPESGGWLPADGTAYAISAAPLPDLSLLARQLLGAHQLADTLARASVVLGHDTACMLDVDPDGSASLLCVSRVDDKHQGVDPATLDLVIRKLAGEDGTLAFERGAFERGGIQVGVLRGSVGASRLEAWRRRGWLRAWLARRLESGVEAFAARVGDRLCIVAGDRGRAEAERLIDRVRGGSPAPTGHEAEIAPLGAHRFASFSVDLAALYDGTRHAAPDWLKSGERFASVRLRWRLPASGVLVADADHVRVSVRLRPRLLASAVARILDEPPPR